MSSSVQEVLRTFEELTEHEKHELAREVLRWWTQSDQPPLSDDDLIATADSVFQALDRAESRDGS